MSCCAKPSVSIGETKTTAQCGECGFRWAFKTPPKGRRPRWMPEKQCFDTYDREWRLKGYSRHEIVGTRIRGSKQYVVACSKSGNSFWIPCQDPPDQVYCPSCDREGPLQPMLDRYSARPKPFARKKPPWKR